MCRARALGSFDRELLLALRSVRGAALLGAGGSDRRNITILLMHILSAHIRISYAFYTDDTS